jgi:ADP-heptose:LPS heptosyltransferase
LVHLAKTVGRRSIVLFGPTDPKLFGYKENINLHTNACPPCFWKKNDWHKNCMLDKDFACMWSIRPDAVNKAINQMLFEERGYKIKC